MLTGGCHCGAVRYEVSGEPFERALCLCTDCQRTTGAPAVAWFTVRTEAFRFTDGAPREYRSSSAAARTFCPACGAQLTFVHDSYEGGRIDVTTATLDDPQAAPPREQIFVRSRIGWMEDAADLPGDLERRPPPTS